MIQLARYVEDNTLGPGYFEIFKCKEFPQYMRELEISEKKLNIDKHLGFCFGRVWWS